MSDSKKNILKKIQNALQTKTEKPFPDVSAGTPFKPLGEEDPLVVFAEQFGKVNGQFIFCENVRELMGNFRTLVDQKGWKNLYCWDKDLQDFFARNDFRECRIGRNLEKADAGITSCEFLVARTGSILLSSRQAGGRTLSVYPPVHIVVATTDQVVYDIAEGLNKIKQLYPGHSPSMITLATGPSRTADIEKTLVLGMHGPMEVYVFLLEK